jgi:hypothetical protein
VRYRPHIEGVETARRPQRISSLAKSIGIPAKLLQSFLEKVRAKQIQRGDTDEGEELLYTKAVLDELYSIVDRLGLSPAERRSALAKIIAALASKRSTKQDADEDPIGAQYHDLAIAELDDE